MVKFKLAVQFKKNIHSKVILNTSLLNIYTMEISDNKTYVIKNLIQLKLKHNKYCIVYDYNPKLRILLLGMLCSSSQ